MSDAGLAASGIFLFGEIRSMGDGDGLEASAMTKLFSALLILMMIVHLIRPLGLPGLRKRGDFWKIALFALAVFGVIALIRPD